MPGLRVEWHQSVPSTSTLAFERAREGDPGRLWVVAQEQTSGRGRRGRPWTSSRGNLFASLLLVDPTPAERVGELPLLAAVALAQAVDSVTGSYQLAGLKWPNDLLVSGAKLSGILLEAETLPGGRKAVVLGIGVNCTSHPDIALYDSTDLGALGFRVEPERLFDALAVSIEHWMKTWEPDGGFDAVRREWDARAVHRGKDITVRNGEQEMTGTFLGLDAGGHLVLGLENGRRETIYAGDVFLNDHRS